ncbi:hypothetical protein EG328_007194 [Venturia inaequalis]|uniref:TRAF-type domain-containing protein n=1 Tax=Venturia inaequalis TaxID=5025 RepID=A0A8H3UV96_VENIN|nr:hypothetical protein EG328_007194 [Venturia inaequalis]KAE9976303.1 hypothetical protein EG327_008176 [Venturia inaequalis]RDI84441.1 hypothetical protein Vi05172_g5707 [Venturia inaequalis]
MSFPYGQYQFDIDSNLLNPYLCRWPQAQHNLNDRTSFAAPISPYTSTHPFSPLNQQQRAFVPSVESIPLSQTSSFTPLPPVHTPTQPPVTQLPPGDNILSLSTPSRVSATIPPPAFIPLKVPVVSTAPAIPPNSILSIKVKEPVLHKAKSPESFNTSSSPPPGMEPTINKPPTITNLLRPIEDTKMLDRDSSVSDSSYVSDSLIHHVLHLEEEAEEWKDRIEDLNISLSTKSREITAMKEALTSMKAQRTRIQALLQKVDANKQKILTQGQELVAQKKNEEAEKLKLEQRLKERSELIEYLQEFRPAFSTPAPATELVTPSAAKNHISAPCPITHYDCPDCGCRMLKAKKENHKSSHCWGRCKNCANEGLACNGGMSSKWTHCFQCGQHGMVCVKPAKTREVAQEILKKGRTRIDSMAA